MIAEPPTLTRRISTNPRMIVASLHGLVPMSENASYVSKIGELS
jgi:hypothetical protein